MLLHIFLHKDIQTEKTAQAQLWLSSVPELQITTAKEPRSISTTETLHKKSNRQSWKDITPGSPETPLHLPQTIPRVYNIKRAQNWI